MQAIFSIVVAYFAAQAFGPDINRWLWGPYRNQHDIGGYALAFMPAVLVAAVVLWPMVLKAWQDNVVAPRQSRKQQRGIRDETLTRETIARGVMVTYSGRIDRTLNYLQSGFKKKGRVQITFSLQRHTMAMQPRERLALEIMAALNRHYAITPEMADQARFALTWGNGGCTILHCDDLTADRELFNQNGIKTSRDLIALEASYRDANVDAVISELFNALQNAASYPKASDDLKDLLKRLTPPDTMVG